MTNRRGSPDRRALYPRHRIDIEPDDLARAIRYCARPPKDAALSLERCVSPIDDVIATLSVRSGFDLLLTALDLPQGGEVILSGFTIPDMARIVRAHRLVPIPLDIGARDLAPTPASLERVIGPKTRVLVVAQLLGARVSFDSLVPIARRAGLIVVNDDAQGVTSRERLREETSADVTFHSFGSIKTATALGGALVRVRDRALRQRMRSAMHAWPTQETTRYARKVATYFALTALREPIRYRRFANALATSGRELDSVIMGMTRGFPAADPGALLRAIRMQPSPSLCAMLQRRIETFDASRVLRRRNAGERMLARLCDRIDVLGGTMPDRTHWLFPINVTRADALIRTLRDEGFDAARGTTSLAPVDVAPERPDAVAKNCESWKTSVVFLPVYPEVPERERDRLADIVVRECGLRAPGDETQKTKGHAAGMGSDAPMGVGVAFSAVVR